MEVRIYGDERGREPVSDYLRRIARAGERSALATVERYIDLLEENGPGLGTPIDRLLDSTAGLYELRPGNHRIAYGEARRVIYLVGAWRKQQRRAPKRELRRAIRRLVGLRE